MIYFLIGYMWLFVHRPFEVWPWLGALHIERVYMIATLTYWTTMAPKQWTRSRMNAGVFALAASIVLSTLVSRYADFSSPVVQNWFKLLVFYILLMSSVHEERDLKVLLVAFVVIMGLYELHSLREYFCGQGVYRMGTWRMVGVDSSLGDPNSFAGSVNYAIPMLLPLTLLAEKRWHKCVLAALLLLAVTCILFTGSRTGFAGLLALAICAGLFSKYRWKLIPLLFVILPLAWTMLPTGLQDRYRTLFDPSRGPANAEVSAESRIVFFFMAIDIWKEYPILGVGPSGFAKESGTGMQSHSLYAQTISNLGTVGVAAVLTLIIAFLANCFSGRCVYRSMPDDENALFCYYVLLATATTVLQLLFFGLGGHNLFRFTWLWYAAFSALALSFLVERQVVAQAEYAESHSLAHAEITWNAIETGNVLPMGEG